MYPPVPRLVHFAPPLEHQIISGLNFRFDREARNAYKIGEYEVPAGFGIIIPAYSIMHSEEYYPEPEKFIPERLVLLQLTSLDQIS